MFATSSAMVGSTAPAAALSSKTGGSPATSFQPFPCSTRLFSWTLLPSFCNSTTPSLPWRTLGLLNTFQSADVQPTEILSIDPIDWRELDPWKPLPLLIHNSDILSHSSDDGVSFLTAAASGHSPTIASTTPSILFWQATNSGVVPLTLEHAAAAGQAESNAVTARRDNGATPSSGTEHATMAAIVCRFLPELALLPCEGDGWINKGSCACESVTSEAKFVCAESKDALLCPAAMVSRNRVLDFCSFALWRRSTAVRRGYSPFESAKDAAEGQASRTAITTSSAAISAAIRRGVYTDEASSSLGGGDIFAIISSELLVKS
mmetsp:Transcript_12358/g.36291  ORF Transcript_12358/g.36291 Transcript_12358/m.36291 type:complete len:320 (+) Transcript_12358:2629-3588(+)